MTSMSADHRGLASNAVERAAFLLAANRPELALRELAPRLASVPDDVDALALATSVHLARSDHAAAYSAATSAMSAGPRNPVALTAAFRSRMAIGDGPGALQIARERARIWPDDPGVLADLSVALTTTGYSPTVGPVRSLAGADRAVAAAPDDPAVRMSAGTARLAAGRPKDAVTDFRGVLERDPASDAALLGLARADSDRGAHVRAVGRYWELLRRSGPDPALVELLTRSANAALTRIAVGGALLLAVAAPTGQTWFMRVGEAVVVSGYVAIVIAFVLIRLRRHTAPVARLIARSERAETLSAISIVVAAIATVVSAPLPDIAGWATICAALTLMAGAWLLVAVRDVQRMVDGAVHRERELRRVGKGTATWKLVLQTCGVVAAVTIVFACWLWLLWLRRQ